MKNNALKFLLIAPIKTKVPSVLIECPKRGLPNPVHNPLILHAEYRANRLSEKAYFTGQSSPWGKITRILNKPL
jgi:hypothetical protein